MSRRSFQPPAGTAVALCAHDLIVPPLNEARRNDVIWDISCSLRAVSDTSDKSVLDDSEFVAVYNEVKSAVEQLSSCRHWVAQAAIVALFQLLRSGSVRLATPNGAVDETSVSTAATQAAGSIATVLLHQSVMMLLDPPAAVVDAPDGIAPKPVALVLPVADIAAVVEPTSESSAGGEA